MSINEIKNRIEKLENAIFFEEMKDFMDWGKYYEMKRELNNLKLKLKEMGA